MTKDEALKLALEALERCVATCFDPYSHEQAMSGSEHFVNQTIIAIKEALANEALEKMAENARELGLDHEPPQRTWVGLTKEERHEISMANRPYCADIMAAHEEELKRRNT